MSSAQARLDAAPMIISGSSPEQMVMDINRAKNALERNNALIALIDSLAPEEFLSVVDSFGELGMIHERSGEYEMLLTAWAEVQPSEALTYARKKTFGDFAINTVLSTWAAADTDAAVAWAGANHENKDTPNPWLRGIIEGIALQDIGRATTLLESLPLSQERNEALRSMVSQLVRQNPEEAKNWTATIQDEAIRSGAYALTAQSIANKDSASAAEWLLNLGDIDAMNQAGRNIARNWHNESPEEAKAWIARLPAAAIAASIDGVVIDKVKENPLETAEWVSQLAIANPETDFASSIRLIVRGSQESDPELAAEWLRGLPRNYDQTLYYHGVLAEWQKQDSQAARAWILRNEADLPDTVKLVFLGADANTEQ